MNKEHSLLGSVLGILKAGHENVKEIWSETLDLVVFRETCFEFLNLCSVQ
jgi:hypothetical protein